MASPAKKPRTDGKSKQFFSRQGRKPLRNQLDVGDKGFLVTCNFKERDSIREVYGLLNEYYSKIKGDSDEKKDEPEAEVEEEEDDITSQLQDQITKTKQDAKIKAHNFQMVPTGVQNLIFIRATIDDVLELGSTIIRDLAETKKKKTKVTLRLLPIATVCKANIEDIKNAAGLLFDKHFLGSPTTFAINFNKRFNNDVQRDEVIKELADLVTLKNPLHKVNLGSPQQSIIVEIIKGNCLLSVVPDYLKLKKYNVNELWAKREEKNSSQEVIEEENGKKEPEAPSSQEEADVKNADD